MVCIPCIVVPVLLWVFHKYIQPFIMKFWNPWKNSKIEQNGTSPPTAQGDISSKEHLYIQDMIKENPVIIFSKTTCSYSNMAKSVLNDLGVSYAEEELDKRDDCSTVQDAMKDITGARTVPRVFIGGKCVGGGSETWSLHNQGKLVPLLKEAGATFKKTD